MREIYDAIDVSIINIVVGPMREKYNILYTCALHMFQTLYLLQEILNG